MTVLLSIWVSASNHLKSSRLVETDPMDDLIEAYERVADRTKPDQTMGMAENASVILQQRYSIHFEKSPDFKKRGPRYT